MPGLIQSLLLDYKTQLERHRNRPPMPFNPHEFLARLKAVLRRTSLTLSDNTGVCRFGGLASDPSHSPQPCQDRARIKLANPTVQFYSFAEGKQPALSY